MKVRFSGYLTTTLVPLGPDLATRRAGAPVKAEGHVVPVGGGILEDHGLGVLVPVEASGLRDGSELDGLSGPLLSAEPTAG